MYLLKRFAIALLSLLSVTLAISLSTDAAADGFNDGEYTHVVYPDWFSDSFLDLREDLAEAVAADKQGLMVFFSTEGCSYCGLFVRKSLGDPVIAATTQERFAAVGLEIFSDAEMTDPQRTAMRVKEFAAAEGVEYAPTLLFYEIAKGSGPSAPWVTSRRRASKRSSTISATAITGRRAFATS